MFNDEVTAIITALYLQNSHVEYMFRISKTIENQILIEVSEDEQTERRNSPTTPVTEHQTRPWIPLSQALWLLCSWNLA